MLNTAFNKTNPIPAYQVSRHPIFMRNEPNLPRPARHPRPARQSTNYQLPTTNQICETNPIPTPIVIPSGGLRSEAQRPKAEGSVQSASPGGDSLPFTRDHTDQNMQKRTQSWCRWHPAGQTIPPSKRSGDPPLEDPSPPKLNRSPNPPLEGRPYSIPRFLLMFASIFFASNCVHPAGSRPK